MVETVKNELISKTLIQYDDQLSRCREVFLKKMTDYGTSWRILRASSLTDQIFIKAQRIRTLEENGESKVGEGVEPEYIGLVNYCIMGLIQLSQGVGMENDLPTDKVSALYDHHANETRELMIRKNSDYGEAWRDMRVSSLTDLILMKVLRTKQIEDNQGKTIVSEGIDANYADIINYALFAMIRLSETNH